METAEFVGKQVSANCTQQLRKDCTAVALTAKESSQQWFESMGVAQWIQRYFSDNLLAVPRDC